MKVELIDHTDDPETKIASAAAICYAGPTDHNSNSKRLQKLLDFGHLSTLRFAYATFRISGVSRVESHQHVRVAHAGILQQSQRYCEMQCIPGIRPPSWDRASREAKVAVATAEQTAFYAYKMLLDDGIPKEDARYILPENTPTEFVMTGNFQMWKQWLSSRTSPHAQWEIRQVANQIQILLNSIAPNVFPAT